MSAQPVEHEDPDDPVVILRTLPEAYREQFLAEYRSAALRAVGDVEAYRTLHELLRLWRLRAVAYSAPGYEDRLAAVLSDDRSGAVPIEDVVPGWPPVR